MFIKMRVVKSNSLLSNMCLSCQTEREFPAKKRGLSSSRIKYYKMILLTVTI